MPEHHSPIMLSQVQMKKALVYCCGIVYTVTHKTSLLSVILLVVGTNSIYHFQVCCLVLLCIFTVLLIYSLLYLSTQRFYTFQYNYYNWQSMYMLWNVPT